MLSSSQVKSPTRSRRSSWTIGCCQSLEYPYMMTHTYWFIMLREKCLYFPIHQWTSHVLVACLHFVLCRVLMQIPPFIHFDAPFLFYALTDVLTDSSSSDAHCKEGYSVLITLPQRYQFLAIQVSLLNELFPYFCERYHFYYKKDNGGEGHQEMFLGFFFVSLGWVLLMKNYTLGSLYWFLKSVHTMAHDKRWTKWSFFELISVTLSFLVCTHVCVCAYVCYVCTYVCTYRVQKRMLTILLYHALPYSLEKGFF